MYITHLALLHSSLHSSYIFPQGNRTTYPHLHLLLSQWCSDLSCSTTSSLVICSMCQIESPIPIFAFSSYQVMQLLILPRGLNRTRKMTRFQLENLHPNPRIPKRIQKKNVFSNALYIWIFTIYRQFNSFMISIFFLLLVSVIINQALYDILRLVGKKQICLFMTKPFHMWYMIIMKAETYVFAFWIVHFINIKEINIIFILRLSPI